MSAFNPEIAAQALIPKEQLSQASLLHLSIHIGTTTVDVALSDAAGGEFNWKNRFEINHSIDHEKAVLQFIRERNWNERVFRKCTISFDSDVFAMVPAGFYSRNNGRELLEFSTGKQCEFVAEAELSEYDAVLIWQETPLMQELMRIFPNAYVIPSVYLLLKYSKTTVEKNEDTIIIAPSTSLLTLIAFKRGLPVLVNAYHSGDQEDILYHASNAAMTLAIDFEYSKNIIFFSKTDQPLFEMLKNYNRNTQSAFEDIEHGYALKLHVLCV